MKIAIESGLKYLILDYKRCFLVLWMLTLSLNATATNYYVGPDEALTELDGVPWLSLAAGDTVNIHYRAEPYRTKVGLRAQGTAEQPVVIRGIRGSNGERPIISGHNATTPANMAGFFSEQYDEFLAVFLIKRASTDPYATYKPQHITFEDLRIEGAYSGYTYTNSAGVVRNYGDGAAAIWAVLVDNLIVRNCEITDNGNGLFVLSKPGGANQVSHNILIEKNHIHDNGTPDSFRQHNIYTQTAGITFQYNHLGRLRSGAVGSVLKDRSAGTVIRHNWIETGARVLDLVDPEEAYDYLVPLPEFRHTYVYGNVFVNDVVDRTTASTSNMIHYGGDTGVWDIYRKGTLHFYNNTVYINTTVNLAYYMRLFDLSTNEETVSMKNNIIYQNGDSNLFILNRFGQARFDSSNWINAGWSNIRTPEVGASVSVSTGVSLVEWNLGEPLCFNDVASFDFTLISTSTCVDAGTSDLDGVILDRMYLAPERSQARFLAGGVVDLGAFEDHSLILLGVPTPPQGIQIFLR